MKTPLYERHEKLGATLREFDGWLLPFDYGDWQEEYEAVQKSVALMDTSHWGRVRMVGKDSLDLLNRLTTNELSKVTPCSSIPTILTTEKGRVLDHIMVYIQDGSLLLVTSPNMAQTVIEWLDKFTFGEDTRSEDLTLSWGMLLLIGPKSAALLEKVFGQTFGDFSRGEARSLEFKGASVLVGGASLVYPEGYALLAPANIILDLWDWFPEERLSFGIKAMGQQAYEALRIEAGVPLLGREVGLEYNPLEAGLTSSVSFTKGCYIGQEVVARLNTYQKVKRSLMGVLISDEITISPNATLAKDGGEAGFVTSVAFSPRFKRNLALAYVNRQFAQPGAELSVIQSEQRISAVVARLPFTGFANKVSFLNPDEAG